ncbi:MAG: hypothetical protein B7Y39_15140 [Bdellovibrio sp. 28-41-41]|nr:MAG: hypothetical protein B7Y39_15140 [Bdellovibrio sp. 28-41-41]
MLEYFSASYQRRKRIQRIISLRDGYDAYRPNRISEGENFLFPRYTWLRFFLTVAAVMIVMTPISYILSTFFGSAINVKVKTLIVTALTMVAGFVAVEIVDSFFMRWERVMEEFKRTMLPFFILFGLAFIYIAIKNPDDFTRYFKSWHKEVNQEIQTKSIPIVAMPAQGLNWRMMYDSPYHLKKATFEEATEFCKAFGKDWQLYDGDRTFYASPNAKFDRMFSVWTSRIGGQMGSAGIQAPIVFSSTKPGDILAVLCINKRIHN